MGASNKPRLLVIDDEPDVCQSIRRVAQQHGYEVCVTAKPREFRSSYESFRPDVVMIDIVMPDMDGVEILQQLAASKSGAHIIMMTGYSAGYLSKALDLGRGLGLSSVQGLQKPIKSSELKAALAAAKD